MRTEDVSIAELVGRGKRVRKLNGGSYKKGKNGSHRQRNIEGREELGGGE